MRSPIDHLRDLFTTLTPATQASIAIDKYPGLQVTQAPAVDHELEAAVAAACEAVAFPDCDHPIPLARDLTAPQRELADLLAGAAGVPLHRWAIPQAQWARRRWLGSDPPGVLDAEVAYTVAGETRRAPLWRALMELADDEEQPAALFSVLPLPARLEAYGDLVLGAYRVDPPDHDFGPLGDAGRAWAPACADRVIAQFAPDAPHADRGDHSRPPDGLCQLLVRALVEAGIPIEARWDALVPLDLDLIAPLPGARRDAVLVAGLEREFPRHAISVGLDAIRRMPSAPLLEHLLTRADHCTTSLMCPPRRTLLAQLREAVADDPALVARIDAHLAGLLPLPALRCASRLYPTSADQLTPGLRKMLEVLGQGWEGDQGSVVTDAGDGTFAIGDLSYVSAFVITDEAGTPQFEALLYLDEDGAVCRAGTTNSVAYVSQMGLSWNIDEPTIEAVHAILRKRPDRPVG